MWKNFHQNCYVARFKNSLTTKLLAKVNFVIFHKRVFLVKLKFHNFNFNFITDAKCCVTSVLLRSIAKKSQNYRFQRFLVRKRSKNLPVSVSVKFVVRHDIQEHLLIALAHSFWKKHARRVWGSDGEVRLILSKVKV